MTPAEARAAAPAAVARGADPGLPAAVHPARRGVAGVPVRRHEPLAVHLLARLRPGRRRPPGARPGGRHRPLPGAGPAEAVRDLRDGPALAGGPHRRRWAAGCSGSRRRRCCRPAPGTRSAAPGLLDKLLWTLEKSGGRGRRGGDQGPGRRRINYADLDVEDLGRVYEALLELEPGLATEPMVRLRRAKLEVVVPAAQGQKYRPAGSAVARRRDETDGDATNPRPRRTTTTAGGGRRQEDQGGVGRGHRAPARLAGDVLPAGGPGPEGVRARTTRPRASCGSWSRRRSGRRWTSGRRRRTRSRGRSSS